MLRGQTLKTPEGVEVALFLMETLGVSQGPDGSYSHKGTAYIDLFGSGAGIEPVFMPFTAKCVNNRKDEGAHRVTFHSVAPVYCADKVKRHLTFTLSHDNDTSDIIIGKVYKQGEKIYDEGRAGNATGNHIHLGFAIGHVTNMQKNIYGICELINEILPQKVMFINNTIIRNDGGLDWKVYVAPIIVPVYKVGDKVKIKLTTSTYATGQKIPLWVKTKIHTISQVGTNKVLLKEIQSWVFTKDIYKI